MSDFRLSKHDDSSLSKNAYQSDVFWQGFDMRSRGDAKPGPHDLKLRIICGVQLQSLR